MQLEPEILEIDEAPTSWVADLLDTASKISKPLSAKQAEEIFSSVICSPEEAISLARFDTNTYTRNRIFKNDALEVMILTWLPGQASPLHNHKGSLCAVKVLAGQLTEVLYDRTSTGSFIPTAVNHQLENEVSATSDEDVHQVANAGEIPLVTLHIYSPPQKNSECFSNSQSLLQGAKTGKDVTF